MNRKDLLWFLVLEIAAVVWAGAVFSLFESRLVAGAMAGAYFVALGVFITYRVSRWPEKWTSPVWYPGLIHLFVVSLPMVITRFLNSDLPFDQVHILGLEGPVFHRLSTTVFSALILGTLFDLARVWLRDRKKGLRERNP